MQLTTSQLNIPSEHIEEIEGLTDKQRAFLSEALVAFRIIASAKTIGKGARQAAYQTRWSAKRIADLYREDRASMGPRSEERGYSGCSFLFIDNTLMAVNRAVPQIVLNRASVLHCIFGN